jgi:large subunit ribosomal protein L25
VVDLKLDGAKALPVLLHVIQEHPVSRKPLHIDFLAVNMEEERNVDVPIQVVGDAEAVDKLGGVLLHLLNAVVVRAKPDDIPSSVELDITSLVDFEVTLHASDLRIPQGVTLITDPAEAVARVQAPRVEEVEEVPEEAEGEAGEAAEEGGEAAPAAEAEGGSSEESEES